MVHIKLSVVFILAAAAFTPVVPLPIPGNSITRMANSEPAAQRRRDIKELKKSLLKLSSVDESHYKHHLPEVHPEVQRTNLDTLSTKDSEDHSASLGKQKPALEQQGSDKGKGNVDLAQETYHTRADSESGSGAAGASVKDQK